MHWQHDFCSVYSQTPLTQSFGDHPLYFSLTETSHTTTESKHIKGSKERYALQENTLESRLFCHNKQHSSEPFMFSDLVLECYSSLVSDFYTRTEIQG